MAPKKRDKEIEPCKNPRMDHIQADHELFLQAFEKPTQIYRFLRTRNLCSPIFLNRTLTYMKYRMSRSHKGRSTFNVDSLLEKVTAKQNSRYMINPGYLNVTFLGFTDTTLNMEGIHQFAHVEIVLLKINHRKRKDSSVPNMHLSLGTADVPIHYANDQQLPEKAPTICISTEKFNNPSYGPLSKTLIFLFRVSIVKQGSQAIHDNREEEEPAPKKRRTGNHNVIEHCDNHITANNLSSNNRNYTNGSCSHIRKIYVAELTVYDKHNRCFLSDGDYDILLQDVNALSKTPARRHCTWENGSDLIDNVDNNCGRANINLTMMKNGAILKFKLNWSSDPCSKIVDRPKLYPLNNSAGTNGTIDHNGNKENLPCAKGTVNPDNDDVQNAGVNTTTDLDIKQPLQIVYQFVYNNNSRQQTEACEDLHCPWCSINSNELYTLLKHLKLCHSRFTFTYVPIPVGARIDVAINEMYDGSYTGSPHDLIIQPNVCAFARNGPVRRASITHILVCRPKRSKPSLSEFLELDDCEYDGQRPFITGHNRLYHHTSTCLPIYPKEMDVDSEGENDPEWLRSKTVMMIDDFSDVNDGEKELMKMWNLHVMKFGFVGDCQIPLACQMFVANMGKTLLLKNLYKNFILHLSSLFDFGLISAVCLYTTMQKLQQIALETGSAQNVLKESHEAQIDNWNKTAHITPKTAHSESTALAPSTSANRKRLSLSLNKNTEGRKTLNTTS